MLIAVWRLNMTKAVCKAHRQCFASKLRPHDRQQRSSVRPEEVMRRVVSYRSDPCFLLIQCTQMPLVRHGLLFAADNK